MSVLRRYAYASHTRHCVPRVTRLVESLMTIARVLYPPASASTSRPEPIPCVHHVCRVIYLCHFVYLFACVHIAL